jgi:RNA polymerase sigma-70 factor (ECF subfamily)
MSSTPLVEHFFRHEYSRLVAHFSKQYGWQNLDRVEDAVQSALLAGLEKWTHTDTPDNPSAWLYKVVQNELLGHFRSSNRHDQLLQAHSEQSLNSAEVEPENWLSKEFEDDQLRMMFVCCHDSIPSESQLALALKVLCGFDIAEIAHRLFISEANVYKRIQRAKQKLVLVSDAELEFSPVNVAKRLGDVHRVLYVLFTEGYLSVNNEYSVRLELCVEAVRLCSMLAEHTDAAQPETFALLALMELQLARMAGRTDSTGGLLLLEEQDRSHWDAQRIESGLLWLGKSAQGNHYSRYHAEAGVAAEHCLAPSLAETRWDHIAQCYLLLEQTAPSAIHRLNRAVAVAQWQGPEAGLTVLTEFEPPSWLVGSYLWSAVLADLHLRAGHQEQGERYKEDALSLAPTDAMKQLLSRRLAKSIEQ